MFGFVIGFIEHLEIVTTSNYSAIANSHALQFTTARTRSSQSALVTVFNAVASSASVFKSLLAGDCLTTHKILDLSCL
jgi:hypothetical protein